MFHMIKDTLGLRTLNFVAALALIFMYWSAGTNAQTQKAHPRLANSLAEENAAGEPLFREYKGVKIGMSATEVRQKLGEPSEKSAAQDFYGFSDKEMAQIFYDGVQRVTAISVNYLGDGSGAPTCKAVLGREAEAKAEGSMYQMIKYPKAGFWLTYSRSGGDAPLTTVTMQKMTPQP